MAFLAERRSGPRWAHLFYLCYVGFVFFQPAVDHATWAEWLVAIASVIVFVVLYAIYVWKRGIIALFCVLAIAALGFAYWPFNSGGSVYIIYAAAVAGFLFDSKIAFAFIGALLGGVAAESWLLHLSVWYWAPTSVMTLGIGAINVHAGAELRSSAKLKCAQAEIEHLAKIAERERIARDMHDVLGHTLSVVILKSELASKIIDHDPVRARTEISEVEQIAREALAEVRQAIRGYRSGSLADEFARARSTLETAGIHVECEARQMRAGEQKLSPAQETVLALVIREAVTNVVRHSGAKNCRILLQQDADLYRIQVKDDGRGGAHQEGNGLRGMRERVEALDGTMSWDGSQGTRLIVTIPTHYRQEAIA